MRVIRHDEGCKVSSEGIGCTCNNPVDSGERVRVLGRPMPTPGFRRRCKDLETIVGDTLTVSVVRSLEDSDEEPYYYAHVCATVRNREGTLYPADWMTGADSPEGAVFMAWDLLSMMTGRCSLEHPDHDLTVDTVLRSSQETIDDLETPAWGCSRCQFRCPKDDVEEVPDGDGVL